MTQASDTRRVQLDMPPKSLERLQSLKVRTEAASYSEVLKAALQLYEFAVDTTEQGGKLVVRSPDGTEKEMLGPILR